MKKTLRTVSVTHDKRFQYIEGNFKCQVEDALGSITFNMHTIPEGRKNCVCRCTQHPTACFYKNKVLTNAHIAGNVMPGIATKQACSNLCAHHPDCGGWEYDSNKKCILKAGEPVYTDNTNSLVTTYAGGKAGAHGCILQNKHPQCPLGKYRTEVDTQSGRIEAAYNCVQCEAGFTSHMINAASCYCKTCAMRLARKTSTSVEARMVCASGVRRGSTVLTPGTSTAQTQASLPM